MAGSILWSLPATFVDTTGKYAPVAASLDTCVRYYLGFEKTRQPAARIAVFGSIIPPGSDKPTYFLKPDDVQRLAEELLPS